MFAVGRREIFWTYCKDLISYVYWTVHHLDSWVKRDQLDVTCFITSLFNAQLVSGVNTSILRSLRPLCWVMNVLTSETCWALNKGIIKQVTSSWSLFTQLSDILFLQQELHTLPKLHDNYFLRIINVYTKFEQERRFAYIHIREAISRKICWLGKPILITYCVLL